MTDSIDNLVLEHLRHIRGKVDKIDAGLADMRLRLGAVESHVAAQQVELVGINVRLDRHEERLSRIGRRLDLVDA